MIGLYSLWMCLSVASEATFRTKKCCIQLITSHDKKDCDGKTNGFTAELITYVVCGAMPRNVHMAALAPNPTSIASRGGLVIA